jgi:hypothetical protein
MMKRREFITLLGGATPAWPLAVRAQQAERMRRLGVFVYLTVDDPEGSARLGAFRQSQPTLLSTADEVSECNGASSSRCSAARPCGPMPADPAAVDGP